MHMADSMATEYPVVHHRRRLPKHKLKQVLEGERKGENTLVKPMNLAQAQTFRQVEERLACRSQARTMDTVLTLNRVTNNRNLGMEQDTERQPKSNSILNLSMDSNHQQ